MTRRVQFADTDLAGVMHFANYYRIMEEAEHAFWRSLGLSVVMAHGEGEISFPRVATSCEYFAPARFEDEIDVGLSLADVGRSSITCAIEFAVGDRKIAAGQSKAVCCSLVGGTFSSIAIPSPIREKLVEVAKFDRGV
jgi:YbgC/YbaW family acyl-CoA thioester hydrolase